VPGYVALRPRLSGLAESETKNPDSFSALGPHCIPRSSCPADPNGWFCLDREEELQQLIGRGRSAPGNYREVILLYYYEM